MRQWLSIICVPSEMSTSRLKWNYRTWHMPGFMNISLSLCTYCNIHQGQFRFHAQKLWQVHIFFAWNGSAHNHQNQHIHSCANYMIVVWILKCMCCDIAGTWLSALKCALFVGYGTNISISGGGGSGANGEFNKEFKWAKSFINMFFIFWFPIWRGRQKVLG